MSALGRMGGVYALLNAADDVADHWVQTSTQAERKGEPCVDGRRFCAAHVATLTATRIVFLTVGAAAARERLSLPRVAVGLAVGAGLHYWADRREPLQRLAGRLAWTGKDKFYKAGLPPVASGAYVLDQAWHHGCRALEALIIAGRD
jgi:hypothetical protein